MALTQPGKTLTRAQIADAISGRTGQPQAKSRSMVEGILRLMCGSLQRGENVKITGFGSFILRDKRARPGRNPKTGVEVTITRRRVVSFRPSEILRDKVA